MVSMLLKTAFPCMRGLGLQKQECANFLVYKSVYMPPMCSRLNEHVNPCIYTAQVSVISHFRALRIIL